MKKKETLVAKAIVFDMDGVITDTMPYHYRAWRRVFKGAGIDVSRFDVYIREGQQGINTVREVFRQKNKDIKNREAKRLLMEKEKLFKRIVKRRFIPGALGFIRYLNRQGFKLALVTGTSAGEVRKILPPPIYKLFNVVVAGDDCRRGKPHPEPYLKTIRKLKVAASYALVIENAPSGIEAAKRAGLYCLALATSLDKRYLKAADIIFGSISELRKRINFSLLSYNKKD